MGARAAADAEAAAPQIDLGPNVRKAERPKVNDDPEEAWIEWGETVRSRKNPMPRKQRGIEPGMDIETILGSVMRQEKVLYGYLREDIAKTEKIGKGITSMYFNRLASGSVACQTWYVHHVGAVKRQIVLKCETVRDGHMAKNFMLKQPEIAKVNLDNLDFTPTPDADEDDDDDELSSVAGSATVGGGAGAKQEL